MSDDKNRRVRDEGGEEVSKKKQKKRKRTTTDEAKPKKLQIEEPSEKVNDEDIDGVEKKPEEPSKRQMKRKKAEKKYTEQREASKLEAAQRAINYIMKWKHAKGDWKFEKLRQIWLMDHLLDDALLPDNVFPIALEYFEGCKGMARQQLVKKMMEVIKKIEDTQEIGENNDDEIKDDENDVSQTPEYLRARQILQALPTEG